MLLRLEGIEKSYGERSLFDSIDWMINPGERIGLVGPNGSGKTTLLQIMIGALQPDKGQVIRRKTLKCAHVEQAEFEAETTGAVTVLSQALSVFEPLMRMEHQILELQKEMAENPGGAGRVADEYSHLIESFRLHGGYVFRSRTENVLQGLGFEREAMHWPLTHLSGGQQSRLKLAQALLAEPDLLMLDEPTNHLDIDAIEWLEQYLAAIKAAIVVVSHDRFFLDQVTKKTVELHQRRLRAFSGNYSFYRSERQLLDEQQAATFERQQELIERTEEFIRRNIAGQKTKQAKSRRKMLERLDRVEAVESRDSMKLAFREAEGIAHEIVRCKKMTIGYAGTPLIEGIDLVVFRGGRFGVVGGNGTGKTTLLKTLLGLIPPLSGKLRRAEDLSWSYFSQTQDTLDAAKTILGEIHDQSPSATEGELRNYLARFLFRGEDVFKKIGVLSGGERSRVALAKLLLRPSHVLLLDEPTNHLDIPAREALETALREFEGTLFVVSHDRYFLRQIETEILFVHGGRLEHFFDLNTFEARRRPPAAESAARESVTDTDKVPAAASQASIRTMTAPARPPASKNERARVQKQLLALEERIHQLEAKRDAISTRMHQMSPSEFQQLNELANSYEAIDLELSSVYSEWENLMMQ
ncbi:MAG TPA: ABC-F family ATP-binding cassette domain-containing protein, partial [Acidobacteriota bacterium]